MLAFLRRFKEEEDGAVTVDWVVLTAAVVGLGVVAVAAIREPSNDLTNDTSGYMNNQNLASFSSIQDVYNGGS